MPSGKKPSSLEQTQKPKASNFSLDITFPNRAHIYGIPARHESLPPKHNRSTVAVFNAVASKSWIDIAHVEKGVETHWTESRILDVFLPPGPICTSNRNSAPSGPLVTQLSPVSLELYKEDFPVDDHWYFIWNKETFPDPVEMMGDVEAVERKIDFFHPGSWDFWISLFKTKTIDGALQELSIQRFMWYSAFRETSGTGVPILRTKLDLGLMISVIRVTVTQKGAKEVSVYIAEDQIYWDYFTNHGYRPKNRHITLSINLDQIPLIRGGSIIPTRERMEGGRGFSAESTKGKGKGIEMMRMSSVDLAARTDS
ncbi:hypothetical protein BDR03DRAFT_1078631 [Suillus americanus]|nr:hypothetical protein BDR03DRAFT_1078631 [Suillus americanus]